MNNFVDWIKPGEYHFCHRCGWLLLPEGKMICTKCQGIPRDKKFFEYVEQDSQTHHALIKQREELAKKRQDDGLKRLFWMT